MSERSQSPRSNKSKGGKSQDRRSPSAENGRRRERASKSRSHSPKDVLRDEKNKRTGGSDGKKKLFVTNIDARFTGDEVKEDLDKQFGRYGEIKDIVVKTRQGSSNSYAFVEYVELSAAIEAVENLRGKVFKGKQMKVQFGRGQRKFDDRPSCHICKKTGHIAKQCRSRDRYNDRSYRDRSRYSSPDRSREKHRDREHRDRDRQYRDRHDRDQDRRRDRSKDHRRQRQHGRDRDYDRDHEYRRMTNDQDREYRRGGRDRSKGRERSKSRDYEEKYRDQERGYYIYKIGRKYRSKRSRSDSSDSYQRRKRSKTPQRTKKREGWDRESRSPGKKSSGYYSRNY